jgi:hypothetical protein
MEDNLKNMKMEVDPKKSEDNLKKIWKTTETNPQRIKKWKKTSKHMEETEDDLKKMKWKTTQKKKHN